MAENFVSDIKALRGLYDHYTSMCEIREKRNEAVRQYCLFRTRMCGKYKVSPYRLELLSGIRHSKNYTDREWKEVLSILDRLTGEGKISQRESESLLDVSSEEYINLVLTYISSYASAM